ncbi:MAG TPA: LysE family translocator [Acidimicrobiia bacterium]|nr:LysE family translocator [Acidimicrobiia bacterium]
MDFLTIGFGLGLAAGLSPGPLHMLVLTTSMQRGLAAGLRVAIAPLLTDVFVITAGLLTVGALPDPAVRVLAVGGGLFILYLGVDALRWRSGERETAPPAADLRRGFLTNLLNPHPWLFWLGVGGPLLRSAWDDSIASAVAFLAPFYLLLVGTKALLAVVASRGTRFVDSAWYRRLIYAAATAFMGMGVWLIVAAAGGTL